MADRCLRGLEPGRLARFARSLGLSVASLAALGVGWSGDYLAWTFPMSDPATGKVVGIRLRRPDGRKFSVKGGREGLFLPVLAPSPGSLLAVAEGPTDTAALIDLGLPGAVGRPSCTGGVRHLVALAERRRPAALVIFADADGPGQDGAGRLAEVLAGSVPAVRVVTQPAKDVREWLRAGATPADVGRLLG
jgi:hypothetical protein